jgi:ribonucleoside-diphosphate reductase alpha chain
MGSAFQPICSLTGSGQTVLRARYLKKDRKGAPKESASDMFWRVARNVAAADVQYGSKPSSSALEFYELMRRLEFLPNSPTLMNAGRDLQQLSACFVLPIDDSLESIFETVKNTALIHKSGGGTGFSFSRIRPKGDAVKTTQGVASGPVSFMQVFDAATEAVRQGGARRGANMGVLRVDHPDILEFIRAKTQNNGLRNFNISVSVTEPFMQAVIARANYPLIHPRSGRPTGHLNAGDVFRLICRTAWETGDPGIIFLDRINRDNPTPEIGAIEATNPCGEQPLLPYESCNLGSINLARMTRPASSGFAVDYPRLARAVRTAVHFLDNVIEVNRYPLLQIAETTRDNRKIGLGVMGWADMLIRLRIPYASAAALVLAKKVMGFIQGVSLRASRDLAGLRGAYPNFSHGRESRRRNPVPVRNATVTTIAPTGTLSIIAGCSSGIEPLYALGYYRKYILESEVLSELHPGLMGEMRARGLLTHSAIDEIRAKGSISEIAGVPEEMKAIYRTALEIPLEWHVRMQAAFQDHCDNAVSKTVNLAYGASVEDVESVFLLAHSVGCKGITVYRDRCRQSQVLNAGCTVCG